MSAPNLINLSSAQGKTYFANLTSTTTTVLLSGNTNQVYKINNITIANISGSTNYDCSFNIANSTVNVPYAYAITVPAKSSLVLTDKSGQIYLEETQNLQGGCTTANNVLSVIISYEILNL